MLVFIQCFMIDRVMGGGLARSFGLARTLLPVQQDSAQFGALFGFAQNEEPLELLP